MNTAIQPAPISVSALVDDLDLARVRSFAHGCARSDADTLTELFDQVVLVEMSDCPRFTEEEALGLLSYYQGCVPSFGIVTRQLAADIDDDPDTFVPSPELRVKLASLSVTQDWFLVNLLAVHEMRRRTNPALHLRELGFPIA